MGHDWSNLEKAIAAARAHFDGLPPEKQAELRDAQRQSFVRAFTTGCEHGVLDFEQCPACRATTENPNAK